MLMQTKNRARIRSGVLDSFPKWVLLKTQTHLAPSAFPLDFKKKSCLIEGKLNLSGFDSFTLNSLKKQYFEDLFDVQEEC